MDLEVDRVVLFKLVVVNGFMSLAVSLAVPLAVYIAVFSCSLAKFWTARI